MSATISGAYASLLFDYLGRLGPDVALRWQALAGDLMARSQDALAPTSRTQWLQLIDQLSDDIGDPDMALKIGEHFQLKHLGMAGHVLISCASLGEASEQVVRYNRLMGDVGNSRIQRLGDWAEDCFEWTEGDAPPPILEKIWAAATVSLGRWLTGRNDLPWQVDFRFAAPADLTHYRRLFHCTPRFGQTRSRLLFPSWVLDLPIAMGNPELRSLAQAQADAVLRHLGQENELLTRVRQLIAQRLASGQIGIDQIAPQLGMSSRTLNRRLLALDRQYRDVVADVRLARAQAYLRDDSLSLAEIAFLLGYGEQSTFQHAFKRWMGMTPGDYRQLDPARFT